MIIGPYKAALLVYRELTDMAAPAAPLTIPHMSPTTVSRRFGNSSALLSSIIALFAFFFFSTPSKIKGAASQEVTDTDMISNIMLRALSQK
jgi:p-aminobenzoyl-glutamate transporter AbgT